MKSILPLTLILALVVAFENCASNQGNQKLGVSKVNTGSHLAQIESIDADLKSLSLSDESRDKLIIRKGKLLLDLGKYDETIATLNQVNQAKSNPVQLSEWNLTMGKAYVGKNEYSKAIQFLNQSERLDKNTNLMERKKLVVQSLVAEREYYPALATLTKTYTKGNQKKDEFYFETAAKTYLKMGFEYKNTGFYQKGLQVANLGLEEFPNNETLKSIQKECLEVLQPEGKL
ncbi:LIC12587 family lipoprotein [Leptospira bandrabouensis]|uniref:Tetratricopeptide repeat protein n=1 Tax=Leptospira bandrabouensis TaxID=2484903 RepID=A0A6H3NK27_9LEPT|nr:hypothetical protein [Leptospira bandrabouensis]MCG6153011.1 hypothetical protein [Leptospira bandrabouensis]TGN03813.1 hypothetical protein EHR07_18490 [Leptospira bandrabouensis]TGN12161.1 hypothetical protein EHR08_12285 [Leptospira bandrabouensis]